MINPIYIYIMLTFFVISCAQTEEYIENCENTKCSEDAFCKMVDDVPICTCNEGFLGNGIICSEIEDSSWRKTMGGAKYDAGKIIIHDDKNNVYVAGSFQGNVDFDPGEGIDIYSSAYYCKEDTHICEPSCSVNEECNYEVEPKCVCKRGFHLQNAENSEVECIPDECSQECRENEFCVEGDCVCKEGFRKDDGLNCVESYKCLTPCGENQKCNNGVCECIKGYNETYYYNSFLTKIKYDGTYQWTKTIFSPNDNEIIDIAIKDSVLYLLGTFKGNIDFDPSDGIDIKDGKREIGNTFLLKLTDSGSYISTTVLEPEHPSSIVLNNDDIYISGGFSGEIFFKSQYIGETFISTNDSTDIFITKLKKDGTYVSTRVMGGDGWDSSDAMGITSEGDIYIAGVFNSTVDFNPTDGIDIKMSNGSNPDVFITKFNYSGNYQWTKTLGNTNYDAIEDLIIDHDDKVLVVGSFSDILEISEDEGYESNGAADIFVSKVNGKGDFLWTKTFGGPMWEINGAIAIDSKDNVYITGGFMEYIKFDDEIERTSLGGYDIFLTKLDKDGKYLWGRTIGGESEEYGEAIDIDGYDNILITGSFFEDIILETTMDSFQSNGDTDIFIFKMK